MSGFCMEFFLLIIIKIAIEQKLIVCDLHVFIGKGQYSQFLIGSIEIVDCHHLVMPSVECYLCKLLKHSTDSIIITFGRVSPFVNISTELNKIIVDKDKDKTCHLVCIHTYL
jgi:hypothetical protein